MCVLLFYLLFIISLFLLKCYANINTMFGLSINNQNPKVLFVKKNSQFTQVNLPDKAEDFENCKTMVFKTLQH